MHGEEEAKKAEESAKALFGAGSASNAPTEKLTESDLTDGVEEINEDLAELENEFYESPCSCCGGNDEDEEYDDEDEDDTVFYSVECPGCGFKLTVDEDTLDAGSFECPECGEVIDFENAAVEEVVFDDEDDEDEKD